MYPENFRYTKEHEWIHVQGDIGTIGITDHAQEDWATLCMSITSWGAMR